MPTTLTENGGPDDFCPDALERGPWMQTSRGGRFFPLDPRPEDIFIEDIANGLAQNGRYNGQRIIDRYYSVAEHSVLMAVYAELVLLWPPKACMATLLHDAPEAYINDLNRATKKSMRIVASGCGSLGGKDAVSDYDMVNREIEWAVFSKFGLHSAMGEYATRIKELDQRIVPLEKQAVMVPCTHEWAFDKFEPLPGIKIQCWPAPLAKEQFLRTFRKFAGAIVMKECLYDE